MKCLNCTKANFEVQDNGATRYYCSLYMIVVDPLVERNECVGFVLKE